jgi:hypothetical protein
MPQQFRIVRDIGAQARKIDLLTSIHGHDRC